MQQHDSNFLAHRHTLDTVENIDKHNVNGDS